MSENRTIQLMSIPIGGRGGFVWNRLHGEREDICEALLKKPYSETDERREMLHTRLRKIDDALDRVMAGSYGYCSKCGQSIDDTKLEIDPALALCLDCWGAAPAPATGDVKLASLKPFDTIVMQTHNSQYRVLLLDPKTGRVMLEGGNYFTQPAEALLRGSAASGSPFKGGVISVGGRLELWVDEKVFLTSPIKSISVNRSGIEALQGTH
jgi:Prokaryotic dksA/traR C4-type zinc finger